MNRVLRNCTIALWIMSIGPGMSRQTSQNTSYHDRSGHTFCLKRFLRSEPLTLTFSVLSGDCPRTGMILNATNGAITDGPGDYSNSADCLWTIAPNNVSQVELRFTRFELEGPASCCAGDRIKIYECPDIACGNGTFITTLSGTMSNIPWSVTSKTGIMRIHFTSDNAWTMSGFDGFYFSPCPAGTFGPGLPNCSRCTSTCEPGKQLRLSSCGAIGATVDNQCVCPAGAFQSSSNASCLPCQHSCKPASGMLSQRTHHTAAGLCLELPYSLQS